jgi:ribosomal protein S4
MYRAIPTNNKLLQKKWAQKEREIHLNKLKEIKPQVEIREPTTFKHLKKKLKKTQMLEGKVLPPRLNCVDYREIH